MQYTRLVFSLYALVLTLWRLGAYSVASYLNWHQNCSNFRNPVVGKKQLSSAYLCHVFKLQCWEVFICFSAERVGITQQPCRSLEIAKNKLIKMDYMLWENSLRKGTMRERLCLVMAMTAHLEMISPLCTAGGKRSFLPGRVDALWYILSVCCCGRETPWREALQHYVAKENKCSLLEASFLDWFIPGKLCRS